MSTMTHYPRKAMRLIESTNITPKNVVMNRSECEVNLPGGSVVRSPRKRKIDESTISEVTTQERARLDNLINDMKRISTASERALISTLDGSSSTFTHSPAYIDSGKLRPYQITGLNWLIALHDNNLSGILADEMGLGKTIQVIALIGYLQLVRKIDGRFLIVVPLTTIKNWESEFQQWCPSLRVVSIYGGETVRQQVVNTILNVGPYEWDVCITSYETCKMQYTRKFFTTFRWDYVILDEGLRVKSESSVLAQVVRSLKATHRLIVTGRLLNNSLHELCAVLSYLMPNELRVPTEFLVWSEDAHCLAIEESVRNNLYAILQSLMLRRLKSDVENIQPYKDINVLVTLQRECYRKILMENIDIINATGAVKIGRLKSLFMQLRKCTAHPYLFKDTEEGPPFVDGDHIVKNSGKMIALEMLLAQLKQRKSRVLIFSQSTRMLDIIEDYLNLHPEYEYCRIDGSVQVDERTNSIAEFQDPESKKFIFLLSTRSGINLTAADSVILYDSDWNPQMDLQAISRAHRIGQTKIVRVFRFNAKNTVDEVLLDVASHAGSIVSEKLLLTAVRFETDETLSNYSQYDGTEWDNLVRKDCQTLVDQIFED